MTKDRIINPAGVERVSLDPLWVRHVMWWQIYPLGFVGAPVRPESPITDVGEHRLKRIEGWLDHLVRLGLNGLMLGPVFASSSHGYDTVDYFRIDPRLGDDADIDALIAAAHERGIHVLFDGVFNHVSRDHEAFQQLARQGPSAATADMFRVRWENSTPGGAVDAEVFEGHLQLVVLNHDAKAVEDLVVDVMTYWLDRGIDGWRLDAAYAVPVSFWARVLPRVRLKHPTAWFSGEVIHGDQPSIVKYSTMNSVTQYELWQGIWHAISDRNFHELAHAIGRHNRMLETFVPSTFVGNHDVTRLTTAVGVDFVPHALAILATVGGTPSFYAGDEYAYEAVKEERLGGDDAIRPEFPPGTPHEDAIDQIGSRILGVTRELIAVRRQNSWLHTAHSDVVEVTNDTIVLRAATSAAALRTILSLRDELHQITVGLEARLIAGEGSVSNGILLLPARGWAVVVEK